jgi:hypothetical protein
MQEFAADFRVQNDLSSIDSTLAKLADEKEKFEIIDIAKFSEYLKKPSPVNSQDVRVCQLDTIHSKFQLTIEEMKLRVKAFIESSQGKISLILFDFSTLKSRDEDFDEAISFSEVSYVI